MFQNKQWHVLSFEVRLCLPIQYRLSFVRGFSTHSLHEDRILMLVCSIVLIYRGSGQKALNCFWDVGTETSWNVYHTNLFWSQERSAPASTLPPLSLWRTTRNWYLWIKISLRWLITIQSIMISFLVIILHYFQRRFGLKLSPTLTLMIYGSIFVPVVFSSMPSAPKLLNELLESVSISSAVFTVVISYP